MNSKVFCLALLMFCNIAIAGNGPICVSGTINFPNGNMPLNFTGRYYVSGVSGSVRNIVGKVCTAGVLRICNPSNGSITVEDSKLLISTRGNHYLEILGNKGIFDLSTSITLDPATLGGTLGAVINQMGLNDPQNSEPFLVEGNVSIVKCGPDSDLDKKILSDGLRKAIKASK